MAVRCAVLDARCSTTGRTPWVVSFRSADPLKIPIDPNGNLTTKTEGADNWTYEWNALNQLTRVTKNSVEQARFAYDGLGRRVEKVAGGVTHAYVYDGSQVAEERLSGGAIGTIRYYYGAGIDDWLARQNADSSMTYFTADHLGSVVNETNAAGVVTLTRTYDAWGNLGGTSATVGGPAFTGREWDPETGLYFYRARYYDPRLGRFLSEDPLGAALLVQNSELNRYAYVRDNPIRNVDPTGLLTTCFTVGSKSWTSTRATAWDHWVFVGLIEDVALLVPGYNALCIWGRGKTVQTIQHTMAREVCITDSVGCTGAPGIFTRWKPATSSLLKETTEKETKTTPAIFPPGPDGKVCDSPPE